MNFGNPILLFGALAFLIPLIIHLLNKRRVQIVRWGPMHLLQEALRQRRRNLKVEQLLLLIVRISLPIILALCLARPMVTWFRQWLGGSKHSVVVILDNSYSMRAPLGGQTVRQRVAQELERILNDLPKGSDVSVILAGQPPRRLLDQPVTALDEVMRRVQSEPFLSGPLALNDAFQMAGAEFKRMANASREVLLISDFQESDWHALEEGGSLPALDAMKKIQPAPAVSFFRVAGDLQENLSIAAVDPSAFVVARDQTVALRARIQNHGQHGYQDIAVRLEADGAPQRSTRVSIAPNAETVVSLSHSFDTAGDHSLTIRLEGDSFPEDNARSLVIPVRDQVNCLLVEGPHGKGPLEGPADFLEIALTPHHSAAAPTLKDLIHTTRVDSRHDINASLAGQEVIILADLDKLGDGTQRKIHDFVEQGGGLIIFAGPNNDTHWLEREFTQVKEGLYPGEVKNFGHIDNGQAPARVLAQRYTHPALTYFNDSRGLKLQDAAFTHWQKLTKLREGTTVLLSLDRGDPLMVETPLGKGRIITLTTTPGPQWNNLPLQPVFVPLMQRLVTYLATQNNSPLSQTCGSMLRLALKPDQGDFSFEITDPQNQIRTLKAAQDKATKEVYVESPDTLFPGIYELRDPKVKSAPPRRFAFNVNPAESDLKLLPTLKAQAIATRLGASFAETHDEYARTDRGRRDGSSLWQPLLAMLVTFLFAEVFLQQRISGA